MHNACTESLDEYVQGKIARLILAYSLEMVKKLDHIMDEMVEELTKAGYLHQEHLTNQLGKVMDDNRKLKEKRATLIDAMRELAQRAHSVYLEATESINKIPSSIDELVS